MFPFLCYTFLMYIRVNGVELYYEVIGEGYPLVMLHGNREDCSIFDASSSVLRERYKVHLLDSRCHGRSSDGPLAYEILGDDLSSFVSVLNIERPVVYGFSDGAIAALCAAVKRPDLFSSLILSGANTSPSGIRFPSRILMRLGYLFTRNKYDRLMLTGPYLKKSDLEKIDIPVLVTAGEHDVVKRSDTEFIASSIPHSKLMILRGEDHGSYIVHSRRIADIIMEEDFFLRSTEHS